MVRRHARYPRIKPHPEDEFPPRWGWAYSAPMSNSHGRHRGRRMVGAIVLVCCGLVPAQEPLRPRGVETTTVTLMLLDVVVTDRDGHAVRGLPRKDFKV